MARPLVALLTDFGIRDHYVGTMKGVLLGVCPDATLVDITHDVPPQDVLTGALELAAAYQFFPIQTVFVAVVDPGVGSSRRAIAAAAAGHLFVGPDNGVLSAVFDQDRPTTIVELSEPRFARATISKTFEGRDRFAPAAGWLACGTELTALGPSLDDYRRLDIPRPHVDADVVTGEVLRVDRFGNLVTNIPASHLADARGPVTVVVGAHQISDLSATYSDVSGGELCALVSSSGYVEIAVSGGSAAQRLGVGRGTQVRLTL